MQEEITTKFNYKNDKPFCIPIIISESKGIPFIELRKRIELNKPENIEISKLLLSCAFHTIPINIYPDFTNKFKSLSSLMNKGIIYRDNEKNQYFFNI